MSDVIRLLPDSVANQIAAGEVIQRPASVIKELVENSIDAGAKNIKVQVIDAGRTSIQVVDDGKGMSETDARLSFSRHATSKIREANDLFSLHTMGFRGEALPSIAAVAQIALRTRQEKDDIGTLLTISNSRIVNQEPCSCPVGCNFKVDNLFYNVPARRKFLKSNSTELKNILTAFERIALVYPEIAFTLSTNGGEYYNLKPGSLRQRIVDIFGKNLNQEILPVDVETSLCKIKGFVGRPESAKKKTPQQFFFVNGRFMKHPYFAKAIQQSYDRLVPNGEQVPYFIYFDVDPADIDVNIHPMKTEIKFENEQSIWQILSAAVREAIGVFNDVPTIDFDTQGKPDIPPFDATTAAVLPQVDYNRNYNPFREESTKKATQIEGWESLYQSSIKHNELPPDDLFDSQSDIRQNGDTTEGISTSHYQFKGQFIITSASSGLMIIDQNRAHIRVLYEQYLKSMTGRKPTSQRMLFPEAVQFNAGDAAMLDTVIGEMEAMGFELSPLGAFSYAINSVPAGLEGLNPSTVLHDMMADVVESGCTVKDEINHMLALSLARKAAVPVGQVLGNEEMNDLINKLFACDNVNYTPDGKGIFTMIKYSEIMLRLG